MNMNIQSDKNQSGTGRLFIKKFKTLDHLYVYDVCSNEIVKVKAPVWDIIDQYHKPIESIISELAGKFPKKVIIEAYRFIEQARDSGFFSSNRPKIESCRKDRDEILYVFKNAGIQQIIIDLTNQCNMRCKYCAFSGKYKYQRSHGNRQISREIAMRAVDYFIENSDKFETPDVTFYGGEPFLRFDLFKEIVEYVKSHHKAFHFSLTTNGTLLDNEKICAFLIENEISINVSLDGPQDIHDRNRVMVDGRGSFDRIIENLSRIKDYAPSYFYEKIIFSPVLTPPYNLEAVNKFFYKSDVFKGYTKSLNIAPVSLFETTFIEKSEIPGVVRLFRKNRNRMLEFYKNALISGRHEGLFFEKRWFKDIINAIHFRKKYPLEDTITVIGQCTPGIRRLFVGADGKFYICEKIGEYYSIGDVESGLNFDKIYSFFEKCDEFFRDCGNCWAVRLCERCFADVNCEDRFDEERKKYFCKSKLSYLETIMGVYCEILEKNPNAFNSFDPEKIL